MTTYKGTQEVEPGLYVNVKRFAIKNVEARGPLPGTDQDEYRRVPMLAMLAMAPLLGLAFVMFLPFIGFAMVAYLVGHKTVLFAGNLAAQAVRVVRPGWVPALAFLTRAKHAEPEKNTKAEPDAWEKGVEKKLQDTDDDQR